MFRSLLVPQHIVRYCAQIHVDTAKAFKKLIVMLKKLVVILEQASVDTIFSDEKLAELESMCEKWKELNNEMRTKLLAMQRLVGTLEGKKRKGSGTDETEAA